jgi:periplasmic protein TonB
MSLKRQALLNYIGASAALHIALGGLVFVLASWASRPIQPPSVFQVSLANSMDFETEIRTRSAIPDGRPAQRVRGEGFPRRSVRQANPDVARTQNRKEAEAAPSGPAGQENIQPIPEKPETVPAFSGSQPFEKTLSEAGPGKEKAPRSDALAHYLQDVRTRLEQAKGYPWLARIQGREGTARVQFMINAAGELQEVHLLESSRSKVLDEEAVATVRRVGRFPRPPEEWHEAIRIQVPMVFQLSPP